MGIDSKQLKRIQLGTRWDLGNEVLYRLCREHPGHVIESEILAKIWLVGRSYSAAIERRRKSTKIKGEAFYARIVGPRIRKANIDKWMSPLSRHARPTWENCSEIIEVHKRLTHLFYKITELEKRSLASKYLHFHFPDLFYIYDSRAAQTLSRIAPPLERMPRVNQNDNVYARHFVKSLSVVDKIEQQHGIYLTPRKLDDYLLRLT